MNVSKTIGSYVLVTTVAAPLEIAIGRLGCRRFERGDYLYCGSALGGLTARLARHWRAKKALHWHIDYFLSHAILVEAWVIPGRARLECLARRILSEMGGAICSGFGSSDCRCGGHLVYFPTRPSLADFSQALRTAAASAPQPLVWPELPEPLGPWEGIHGGQPSP